MGGFYTLTFSFVPSCRFVDLLGGNIWAESEAGKGSTFYFCVPFLLTTSKDSPPRANKGCIWCYNCECILVCLLCFSILEHEMNHSKEGQVRYMGCIPESNVKPHKSTTGGLEFTLPAVLVILRWLYKSLLSIVRFAGLSEVWDKQILPWFHVRYSYCHLCLKTICGPCGFVQTKCIDSHGA